MTENQIKTCHNATVVRMDEKTVLVACHCGQCYSVPVLREALHDRKSQ